MPEFRYRSRIEASAEKVFDWHSRPGAFERLKPPWEKVEVVERHGTIKDGDRIVIKTKIGPFAKQWEAVHCDYIEGRQFCDILVKGPFAKWEHTHRFEPDGASACYLEDEIRYDLPFGFLGNLLGKSFTINKLNRMFAYRHQVTQQDLKMHNSREGVQSMKILTTGGNGLIGSALAPFLRTGGHEVNNLTRNKDSKDCCDFHWNPHTEELDTESLEGVEAVVHLAGENIAQRWTEERKSRIKESRAKGTQFLSESLAKLENPPRVLVCASAIGYYGDRGDEVLKEDSPPGDSFLAEVCKEWEAATKPAVQKGIRVVNLRIGVVLSPEGGALAKMLLPFKMGVGGVVGSGEQYWSWIALDDLVGVIHHAITTESLSGPVNAVAPNPVTNRELTDVLGEVLSRPTLFPLPAFAARVALREMADELLLASARVEPAKLQESGYQFRYPHLEGALRNLLGKQEE